MLYTSRSIAWIAGLAVFVGATWATAQDWPQWRGPNRDGKAAGFTAPATWPESLTQNWKATVGPGDATPALVGDRLYVSARQGDDEVTLCLNAGDGTEVWKDKYPAPPVTGAAGRHPGLRSSPAVAEGKIVTLGVTGILSCLDAATGKLAWRKDPFPEKVPQFFTATSPIIVDAMAVAQLGKAGEGAMIAFDLATGNEKWRWDGGTPEYASPVLMTVAGTRMLVTLTSQDVAGVGLADGKPLWQLPFAPASRAYNAATPIVDGQKVIYTGAGRGTKAVKVEKQGDRFVATELWSNPDLAPQYNSPVLKDGFIYGLSDRGKFFCINAENGQTAWTDDAEHGRGFGAIVDAGSCLLALPSTAELIVLKPSGAKFEQLAAIKVAETDTYAHPVVAGKRIFIRDQDSIILYTVP
ncbi:MAG: PQQ-binding-like beta-propeller repeat protein [Thermoguttaceae bacterium]